ncbi:energy-coupling factor transport system permease protein [Pelagirhabdus alkalitolerans]|uniref:Energy-coupling factor transport system permease protein n=1 Tax=Pelagirhabdus alkalitolerans TaxID=1612202 RepID=A0A1G6MHF5_9BACI|nr:energy-coupling factor transporter transmembrane protein EcfT [Pelagirhabdus alkalitolerans]SDC54910.1 energy-coupling factor transport system permease protein [Pelagirhabdus alkalitolerans]
MKSLILGRYFPNDSIIHRLDARAKLVAALYFIGLLFFIDHGLGYLFVGLFTLGVMYLTKIRLSVFIKGVRPLIFLILFAAMMRVLFTGGGEVFVSWGPFTISSQGLWVGLFTFMRFILIIFISTVLTLSTKPVDLTDAINALLKPLRKLGVPVDDFALMLSISLRFIPNLLDETQRVMDAQRARGVIFGEGTIVEQMKKLVPIVLPLFASSLNRAEEMADVMDVKNYQSGEKRTHFRQLTWHTSDSIALLMMVGLTAVVIVVNYTMV